MMLSWWLWPSASIPLLLLLLLSLLAGFFISKSEFPEIYEAPETSLQNSGLGALPSAGEGALLPVSFQIQQGLRGLPAPDEDLVEAPPSGSEPSRDGSMSPISSGNGAGGRTILSYPPAKHDTAVVALMDGTVYLVDNNSGKIHGSFSSGPSLSTSYQALSDDDTDNEHATGLGQQQGAKSNESKDYFIDCGDDWNLYEHSKEFGRRKLPMTAKEYVNLSPVISIDGSITLGSKSSTVFLVDASSGKVIRTLHLPNDIQSAVGLESDERKSVVANLNTGGWVEFNSAADKLMIIIRTDYSLSSYNEDLSKRLWSMTVSEINASIPCQGFGGGLSLISVDKLGLGGDLSWTLQCQKIDVYRVPDINPFHLSLDVPKVLRLPEPIYEGEVHTQSPPSQNPLTLFIPNDGQISSYVSQNLHKANDSSLKKFSVCKQNVAEMFLKATYGSSAWYLIPLLCIMPLLCYLKMGYSAKSDKQSSDLVGKQSVVTKKRKTRKVGKDKNDVTVNNHGMHRNEGIETNELSHFQENNGDALMSLLSAGEVGDGRWVGDLFVSNAIIAKGSNGTVVFEGIYNGRAVAVKRLVRAHHDLAYKEIQNLIASDQHPNIVCLFGVKYDLDFVYLSLERCTCSLNDLIQLYSDSSSATVIESATSSSINEYKVKLDSIKGINKDLQLWRANGFPSPQLLKLMRDVVSGLAHLHELGIIHRDIKPQNVLINSDRSLSAKLSDMGISKRLLEDMSSLGHHATGHGSSGWRAPEQLLHGRQTRALDLFSLGCVLFFCLTKGKHPFGSYFDRDSNILNNHVDLFLVEHIPEAVHLFSHLLDPEPECRPKALEVLQHPLFWSSEMRLSFLKDASDRVELEDRENESELLKALENIAPGAFGGKWGEKLDAPFITDMGRYRKYKFDCTRHLLRLIRNKLNHYGELPRELQDILGSVPEGFDGYFTRRFPKLLIEVYKVMHKYCREDDCFQKYFNTKPI